MQFRNLDTIGKMLPSLFWGVLENRICQVHFQKHPLHVPKRRAKEGEASEVGKKFLSKLPLSFSIYGALTTFTF